jgi:hypothetical protein
MSILTLASLRAPWSRQPRSRFEAAVAATRSGKGRLGRIVAATCLAVSLAGLGGWGAAGQPSGNPVDGAISETVADGTMRYVAGDVVNGRAGAGTSFPVVRRFVQGEAVQVTGTLGDWSQLGGADAGIWIASRFLTDIQDVEDPRPAALREIPAPFASARPDIGEQVGAEDAGVPEVLVPYRSERRAAAGGRDTPRPAAGRSARSSEARPGRSGRSSPTRSRRSRSTGGSCPCSGPNVCIGPRGGRYCITSGGNKRYGV